MDAEYGIGLLLSNHRIVDSYHPSPISVLDLDAQGVLLIHYRAAVYIII